MTKRPRDTRRPAHRPTHRPTRHPASTRTALARAAFRAAPLCLLVYGVIRLSDTDRGPDLAWTVGHLFMLSAVLLFAAVLTGLHRLTVPTPATASRAARLGAGAGLSLGLTGALALTVQGVIDLVVGLRAADRPEMQRLFEEVQSHPGVMPAVYTVGPLLFYVGLLWLTVQPALRRRIGAWCPVVLFLGIAAMTVSLDLLPLGALLFGAALAPLARALPSPAGAAGHPLG
ncbi:hypothetical protein AB0P12_07485 [Streptomyces subrutilus]|uniref:hypothetical protein n=1 Tax=Streptomyces subrutilus TaxID=36818 RepID=UPI003447181D